MKPLTDVTQEKIMLEVLKLDKEKKYDAEIKLHREKRSKDANAYFHVLVNKLARHFDESDEEMKVKMVLGYGSIATELGQALGMKLPKGTTATRFYPYSKWYKEDEDGCDCYLFYERTHLLDKSQMAKLIDGVVWECKQVGIETMPPHELQRLKEEWEKHENNIAK